MKGIKYIKKYENVHTKEVQAIIKEENKNKAGIYMIYNEVNKKKYVGSAAMNRLNVRFRNHLIHRTGSKRTAAAVAEYGIESFSFYILEYYSGVVLKENLSAKHVELLELETKYIRELSPEYNILQEGVSSKGDYSQERRERVGNINRGKVLSAEEKEYLSKIAKLRNSNMELRKRLSALSSKPVTLYKEDGTEHSKYPGIRLMAKAFRCCNKTINKAIRDGSVFKNIGKIKLDGEANP
jgi:group I intron endonuclease